MLIVCWCVCVSVMCVGCDRRYFCVPCYCICFVFVFVRPGYTFHSFLRFICSKSVLFELGSTVRVRRIDSRPWNDDECRSEVSIIRVDISSIVRLAFWRVLSRESHSTVILVFISSEYEPETSGNYASLDPHCRPRLVDPKDARSDVRIRIARSTKVEGEAQEWYVGLLRKR